MYKAGDKVLLSGTSIEGEEDLIFTITARLHGFGGYQVQCLEMFGPIVFDIDENHILRETVEDPLTPNQIADKLLDCLHLVNSVRIDLILEEEDGIVEGELGIIEEQISDLIAKVKGEKPWN